MGVLEKVFHLKEHHTDVRTEVTAGITTFMTMAYILAVNPSVLSAAGMDSGAVFTATALAAVIATLMMALFSNYPFVLASGMGVNAYFAYTVVTQMGYTWEVALAAVFVEGIIFIILSLTNVREAVFNAVPMNLKHAVSVGIGLFIAFTGLQNAKIVVGGTTLVAAYSFKKGFDTATFHSVGITVLLALIGILLTSFFMIKKVKGNILWGILLTWGLGMVCELTGLYQPNAELGMLTVIPDFSKGIMIPSLKPTFLKLDFSGVLSVEFLIVVFAFSFVNLFDTVGCLTGLASKAEMLDQDGKLPKIKGALLADAIGTSFGALFGTSTVITFIESATGIAEGGRTGLTAVVSAILFALSLFLAPIFLAIPAFATAPALIIVGFLMISSVAKIDFQDYTEAIPAYICMIAMPFMYSISEGISLGIVSYVVLNLASGKAKSKKISALVYVLAIVFVLKYTLI